MGRPHAAPYRLAVVTALWRRPAVAEAVLRHFARLRVPGTEITVYAVRSPEDPEPAADVPGVVYAEAPNAPLSTKWNAVLGIVPHDVDGVMVVGSDDLVSAAYVAEAVRLSARADVVAGSDLVFACAVSGRLVRAVYPRMGAGRLLRRETAERMGWRPWPSGLDRGLDSGMDRRLHAAFRPSTRCEASVAPGPGPPFLGGRYVVDVKSAVNLWPFDTVARGATPLTADERADLFHELPALRVLLPMATKSKVKAGTFRETPPDVDPEVPEGAPYVTLRALQNITGEMAGTPRRVYAGQTWACPPERLHDLVKRRKIAEPVEGDG